MKSNLKKYANLSLLYFILAMVAGVFYREYTKALGFQGRTALAFVHGHFLVLGTLLMLIVLILAKVFNLDEEKKMKPFLILHSIGLPLMGACLFARGIVQVSGVVLSSGADHAISGIAGISHVLVFVAILMLLLSVKNAVSNNH